jgi:choline dehydrogenase-like flavoprotein
MTDHYDTIIVGTSFASSFFLKRYLELAPKTARILVLERGNSDTKAWQLANRKTSSIDVNEVFINKQPEKEWLVSPGFGGNSKCWWGGASRMMPGDFELQTRYGVGTDWPMKYDDLETYYGEVERIMAVSGPADSPMPRSTPMPLPPHRFSDPDLILKKAFPDGWFHPATVRASAPTGTRGVCCATGLCELCPQDAKFTIQNGLAHIYDDPRVKLLLQAEAKEVIKEGDIVTGVNYSRHGQVQTAKADLVILAANAIFNPYILLRSGITHPLLGKRLHEQMPVDVCLNLKGVKAYNGSTSISGNGYLFYEGEHRRDYAACLLETWNAPFNYRRAALRTENGRWTERAYIRFMFDDIPRDDNTVTISSENPDMPETNFNGYSDYAMRGMAQIPKMVETLAKVLPIEGIESISVGRTTAHIQGTAVMGNDPATSVVDRYLVHQQIRNLLVLGASAYPTASPAYPTLTLSALSLWAADHLLEKGVKHA